MSFIGIVALVIIGAFLLLAIFSAIAINRPRTKEEEAIRFRQDCEEFDKYMESKRKKQ